MADASPFRKLLADIDALRGCVGELKDLLTLCYHEPDLMSRIGEIERLLELLASSARPML